MQGVDSPGGGGRLREQGPGVVCSPSFKVPTAVGFNSAASTQRGVSLPRVFQSSKPPFTELSRQELEQQVAVGLGVGRPGIRDGGASPVGSVVIRLGGAAPAGGTPGVCGRAAAGRGHAWRWPVGGSPSRGGSVAGGFGVCPGWSGGSGLEGAGGCWRKRRRDGGLGVAARVLREAAGSWAAGLVKGSGRCSTSHLRPSRSVLAGEKAGSAKAQGGRQEEG